MDNEKTLTCAFRSIEADEKDKKLFDELNVIYKEMGQKDDLLSHSPSRVVEYPWVLSHIKGERILDAGCGASPLLVHLKRKGIDDLTGIDTQSTFENPTFSFKPEWERIYGVTYQQANLLNYRSKAFDTVYCISVIEHIFRPIDKLKALVNLWENVKDGGRLVVSLDFEDSLLAGFYLAVRNAANVVDAFSWEDKVFGMCLEKVKDGEGLTEWWQQNKGI